ncbi:MAG: DNA repair protein RecO [Alphaproteobacteria bacterium]|nr:DNA repair protein RecO [Alphaproteobacteria bacterium]
MHWSEDGIVLSARKHGESAAIIQLLTRMHGRHAGLVRGGAGRRARGIYQPGNRVTATWRARLEDHLGSYTCELLSSPAAALLDDPARLAGLAAACAMAAAALPERAPHPEVYDTFSALLERLAGDGTVIDWAEAYVRWELSLLAELGYGLDLSACAATGRNDGLAWVSPRSGRAVSLSAGEPYRDKLLPLPAFLLNGAASETPDRAEVIQGLTLTGHFLARHVFAANEQRIPAARQRLAARLGDAPAG